MDPIDYLFSLERFGIKFGLENIRTLCDELDRPQQAFRSIVIAGTNGKGSLTAMVDTALRAAGHRIGRYTSPHLVTLEERFVIDGRPIPTDELRREAAVVRDAIDQLRRRGTLTAHPTFFEATTAVAFGLFRRAGVELALLEVGLGGRFDATNVVTPLATAITSIDLDHERYLGASIREIASEKAGVIKAGVVAVVGEGKVEAVEVFEQACRERGARLVQAKARVTASTAMPDGRLEISLSTTARRYGPLTLSLRGRHQVDNAIVATRLLEELNALGVSVSPDAIVCGLTQARWRGRLELVRVGRAGQILLDAAHNPAAIRALVSYLDEVYPAGLPIVFGAMRDKDATAMLQTLAPCATRLVCTAPHTPRAIPAEQIGDRARQIGPTARVVVEPNCWSAVRHAWDLGPTVCATGSIFLIGEILGVLEDTEDVCSL